jgi:hypothetical protein
VLQAQSVLADALLIAVERRHCHVRLRPRAIRTCRESYTRHAAGLTRRIRALQVKAPSQVVAHFT